jgi:hypothetical protein
MSHRAIALVAGVKTGSCSHAYKAIPRWRWRSNRLIYGCGVRAIDLVDLHPDRGSARGIGADLMWFSVARENVP